MKISKKKLILLISISSVLLLTAVIVGILCAVLLTKEKPITVNIERKVAIVYEDETELKVSELFGVQVTTKDDYWILYDGYDTNIMSIGLEGKVMPHATGTTNLTIKVCTKSNTIPYILTLHIVSKGYASSLDFEYPTIYFSYLEPVYNRLTIHTSNDTNYLYPVDVISSNKDVIYDANTGKVSYIGNKLPNNEYLSATITCKVRKSENDWIEESFIVYVDFTKYATHLQINNQNIEEFTYYIHANDNLTLNAVGVNKYEEGATDVAVEYVVVSRPEGAEGYEIDNSSDSNLFHAGSKLGTYQIVAKAISGIDKLGNATFVTGIFHVEVIDRLLLRDCQVKVLSNNGVEVSSNLLYVGETYELVIETDKKKLKATNLFDIATPNHMYINYDKTQYANAIRMNFLFDHAGEYTFLASYLDKCDSSKHATIDFSFNFKVFDHSSTTIRFTKGGNIVVPTNQTILLNLYDKNYEEEALKDGYCDNFGIRLYKTNMLIDEFEVIVDNTNIAYYDEQCKRVIGLQCGKTRMTIKDPTTTEVWIYSVVVENVLGSIANLGNFTLYTNTLDYLDMNYPNEVTIDCAVMPIYAVKDWQYDCEIIDLIITDTTISFRAKSVGKTSIVLGGIPYATISVIEYAGQENYAIKLFDGDRAIHTICGKGNDKYTIVITKNDVKVNASIKIETIGLYAFLLDDELYLKYEESGTLIIHATVDGVTIVKEIQVKVEE